MKPKFILSLLFVSFVLTAYSSSSDSTSHKRKYVDHIQFLFGNYTSLSFLPMHVSPAVFVYNTPDQIYFHGEYNEPNFVPLYSYSIGFDYKVDFSQKLGLKTGLNYFTYGFKGSGNYGICDCDMEDPGKFSVTVFSAELLIPLELIVYKKLKKGRFVFATGPDFYFPTNTFGRVNIYYPNDPYYPGYKTIHYHDFGGTFWAGSMIGFTTSFGYEKVLSKKLSIEIMPDFRILNLVPIFQLDGGEYRNYVFNMALGLSTYLTFY